MGLFKNEGSAAVALMEEMAEAIQVIAKQVRFDGDWDDVAPKQNDTRWNKLCEEMKDVQYQWERLCREYYDARIPKLIQPKQMADEQLNHLV